MTKLNSSTNTKKTSKNIEDLISKISLEVSKLSYEKSIQELDEILNKLQTESLLVDELQISYLKANLYIEHCEKLLDNLEQEIVEINSKDITSLRNQ